jgi:dephospho-CoA kinase
VKRATWVVDNGGTLQQTQAQVEQVWRSILEGA